MHGLAVLTLLAFQTGEVPATQRLTMDKVAQMAVASSPALKAAQARARRNEEQAKSLRGRLFPLVNLSDEYQRWNSPFDETKRRVQTDVAAKLANVRATASALESGRAAIGSAEEAYRVTTVLLAVGSANTTDLLDAQSALTQARLNFARTRYE